MSSDVISLVVLGGLLLFGAIVFLVSKKKSQEESGNKNIKGNSAYAPQTAEGAYKKNPNANVVREDMFKFMEFDRIEDNMIISQNGEKYTAVVRCKGINYNLMSEVEQLSVEEGFINFLNTLKYPIQLYVQAQSIDLKENISKYRANMKDLIQEYDDLSADYSMAVNSLEATEEEIDEVEKNRNRALNVLEYGQDIIRYVEKLSLNKNMLQRNFYVLVSYYKSEITGASNFKEEEILDICYSELFTRVNNIMSGLSMSSVSGEVLKSNDIAELLYSSYNRDDHNVIKVREALDSGFYRLYSTSEDAITKKHKRLLESIRKEAEYKAVQALAKAVEEGNIVTEQDIEDTFEQESSKQALELIKKERIDEKIKDKAKKHVIDDYKEGKKKRMQEKEQVVEEQMRKLAGEDVIGEIDKEIEKLESNSNELDLVQETKTEESADDSIV
ncbi:MAG: hypothetical protein IKV94_05790 [Clostridia bacterium]|nr:hypothetical protein [Clostridia bacterium]